jgi:hypothetical protein
MTNHNRAGYMLKTIDQEGRISRRYFSLGCHIWVLEGTFEQIETR